jgi:CHAT domain-containing protein
MFAVRWLLLVVILPVGAADLFAAPPQPLIRRPGGNPSGLEDRKENRQAALARHSQAFRRLRRIDAQAIAKALPADTAFIDILEYRDTKPDPKRKGGSWGQRRFLAFMVKRDKKPVVVPLGAAEPIERAVHAWRKPLQARPPGKFDRKEADELSKRVWLPLAKALGDVKTVLISPDGVLHLFPFAALPGKRPGTCLIEDVAIGYTRASWLLDEPGREVKSEGLLLVAEADDGKPAGKTSWKARAGAKQEAAGAVAAFRAAFPKARTRTLIGAKADRSVVLAALEPAKGRRWRYLHLATRGVFRAGSTDVLKRNPLLASGMALAGASKDAETGVLTAEDVAGLDLRGVDLVVLSADESARGVCAGGQGMLGLVSAFHEAGARNVLGNLWRIDGEAAKMLVTRFYDGLWRKKLPKLEALRQAQLFVIRNPGKVRPGAKASPPLWWAGWVHSGRP